ncbi:hypothetical protein HD553DRAFT_320560 [Filobasidium floriforme]|uniref:uncharacterized protein n=1 Tax=Filobasidium floriforme TaxID=5210 RepID=UPI001E8CBA25|nr:uncharacterized protein HD553DRAFT_320560 [Filobasidium floriforme]KAH8077691.1 hypothetical protein HD553DRAFT_320560 [Filobasidium floriforme]
MLAKQLEERSLHENPACFYTLAIPLTIDHEFDTSMSAASAAALSIQRIYERDRKRLRLGVAVLDQQNQHGGAHKYRWEPSEDKLDNEKCDARTGEQIWWLNRTEGDDEWTPIPVVFLYPSRKKAHFDRWYKSVEAERDRLLARYQGSVAPPTQGSIRGIPASVIARRKNIPRDGSISDDPQSLYDDTTLASNYSLEREDAKFEQGRQSLKSGRAFLLPNQEDVIPELRRHYCLWVPLEISLSHLEQFNWALDEKVMLQMGFEAKVEGESESFSLIRHVQCFFPLYAKAKFREWLDAKETEVVVLSRMSDRNQIHESRQAEGLDPSIIRLQGSLTRDKCIAGIWRFAMNQVYPPDGSVISDTAFSSGTWSEAHDSTSISSTTYQSNHLSLVPLKFTNESQWFGSLRSTGTDLLTEDPSVFCGGGLVVPQSKP